MLTSQKHNALLQQYPELIYAVLMLWVQEPTWQEVHCLRRIVVLVFPASDLSALRQELSAATECFL